MMEILISFGILVIGGIVLVFGANKLVDDAVKLARNWNISPMVIGLTIVAFGTSAPELTVNVISAIEGHPEMALGNIMGSNIFNVFIILGVCAFVKPLIIPQEIVKKDAPLLLLISLISFLWLKDQIFSFWEGFFFVTILFYYTFYLIIDSRNTPLSNDEKAEDPSKQSLNWILFGVFLGLALLIGGARLFLFGAVEIATIFNVPKNTIALTIVAVGTSLPELAASIVATLKNQREIAIGNVIGSNLFNLLGALGFTAMVSSDGLPADLNFLNYDSYVFLGSTLITVMLFNYRPNISRINGACFIFFYVLYITHLLLLTSHSVHLDLYHKICLQFLLPASLILLFLERISHRLKALHLRGRQ